MKKPKVTAKSWREDREIPSPTDMQMLTLSELNHWCKDCNVSIVMTFHPDKPKRLFSDGTRR